MGCKAKYVPIRANAFLKSIYLHHAARVNPKETKESERVGRWSQAVTPGQDKWQRGDCIFYRYATFYVSIKYIIAYRILLTGPPARYYAVETLHATSLLFLTIKTAIFRFN